MKKLGIISVILIAILIFIGYSFATNKEQHPKEPYYQIVSENTEDYLAEDLKEHSDYLNKYLNI
jgi:ABC-type phosphate/phosphonate transport system substrate-binding protein